VTARATGRYGATHAATEDDTLACGTKLHEKARITEVGRYFEMTSCRLCRAQLGLDTPATRTSGLAAGARADSPRLAHRSGQPGCARAAGRPDVDWQGLMNRLGPLRRRWDLAVITNLGTDDRGTRPADLRETINAQVAGARQISWKVLEDTLHRLESSGYIARRELPEVPRETRYWLLRPASQLITALTLVQTWYDQQESGQNRDIPLTVRHAPGSTAGETPPQPVPPSA
jgi:DNA-binding HxlR family transcriptional regulator